MLQPERNFNASGGLDYRYGFNGKENDNEVKGEGNHQDYGMRIYDPRIGRFLSTDPITRAYPELTPYQYASNTPIQAIDLDGLESAKIDPVTGNVTAAGPVTIDESNRITKDGWVLFYPSTRKGAANSPAPPVQKPKINTSTHSEASSMTVEKARATAMIKQAVPKVTLHGNQSVSSKSDGPLTDFEIQQHEQQKEYFNDLAGLNADGTPKPATKLGQSEGWNRFADHVAKPIFEIGSAMSMIGAAKTVGVKMLTQKAVQGAIDGATIGLGLDADLAFYRGTGAITYRGAGWQEAGLTKVDWGRASIDNYYFKESFAEAAKNSKAIRFDVTNFNPFYSKPGITNFEFNHIITNPSLLQKTTFVQNGNIVRWNGSGFTKL